MQSFIRDLIYAIIFALIISSPMIIYLLYVMKQ
jgi:hypothetical protein